jgi:hypothetical protein
MISLAAATKISSEKIGTLHRDFQKKVRDWLAACIDSGVIPYVYEGFRTLQRQKELFALGPNVTRAMPGQSFHNYGRAIDWVPIMHTLKAADMYDTAWVMLSKPDQEKLYLKCELISHDFGMRGLSWESGHLEDASFVDWKELKAFTEKQ